MASHPTSFPPLSKTSKKICHGIRLALSAATIARSSTSSEVSSGSDSDDSPLMSAEGTSSSGTSSQSLIAFQMRVEASNRRAKMQRRPFEYATRRELRSLTEELIGQQQAQVFHAHSTIARLKKLLVPECEDTKHHLENLRAKQRLCDAHFARLQRAQRRGHSPGRCLVF
mmetsp:Transcript_29589/g.68863  ORF Transcript_29589/g.68863 Transcript_29589/m.68863 type:complete len:170 (-) Transcript_29589:101-610(-)